MDGRAADMEGGEEGVGRGRLRGDVVQEEGRGWSGGEEQGVAWVEGEGVDGGLLIVRLASGIKTICEPVGMEGRERTG